MEGIEWSLVIRTEETAEIRVLIARLHIVSRLRGKRGWSSAYTRSLSPTIYSPPDHGRSRLRSEAQASDLKNTGAIKRHGPRSHLRGWPISYL